MLRVCWCCQRPGADQENYRGEPVHRDCLDTLNTATVEVEDSEYNA